MTDEEILSKIIDLINIFGNNKVRGFNEIKSILLEYEAIIGD